MDRREYLTSGLAAASLALVGCSSDGDTTTETSTTTADSADTTTEPMGGTTTETMDGMTTEAMDGTTTEAMDTTTESTGGMTTTAAADQVVEVAPSGLNFAPDSFTVEAGDTVRWVWRGSGHNVVANDTPDGSDWSGTPGAPSRTFDRGYTYEFTFETAGEYTYYCDPHRSAGMTGSFTVE